jgi:DNA-binding CsgD family transcriptional regulator
VDTGTDLLRGREAVLRHAWSDALESLERADRASPLAAPDLELLGRSAYMQGDDDTYVGALERTHRAHLETGDVPAAVRCTFWIGHSHLFRGHPAPAAGWFARGRRLLDSAPQECVERGYLLIPVWLEQMAGGDYDGGYASAGEAVEIGERFGDHDLVWLARADQARALLRLGRTADGLSLVDEAMVAASAGDLSPIVTGIVYCNTIGCCRSAYALEHARACTEALTRWCERQPEMIAHNGLCLVHRAELLQFQGAWDKALDEARRAGERFTRGMLNRLASGKAQYRQGEIHRLHGAFPAAERAYREASRLGCEPQPGLALLRLAQGQDGAAAAALRRAVGETIDPLRRADLLPAYVEVMLEAGDLDAARTACRELERIAKEHSSRVLSAMSAHALGALALAEGDASLALVALRDALGVWQELDAPYETARVRELVGRACRALGDDDTAALEFDAARGLFDQLGAIPDTARVAIVDGDPVNTRDLTARELEVLRHVAAGNTNREIAAALVISEHTVARHVQNIFAKLGVSSRTAAAAAAFEHDLARPAPRGPSSP